MQTIKFSSSSYLALFRCTFSEFLPPGSGSIRSSIMRIRITVPLIIKCSLLPDMDGLPAAGAFQL